MGSMAGALAEQNIVRVTYKIDAPVYDAVKKVAERRNLSVENAAQKLLAAGMAIEGAKRGGYEVEARMPDGTIVSFGGPLNEADAPSL